MEFNFLFWTWALRMEKRPEVERTEVSRSRVESLGSGRDRCTVGPVLCLPKQFSLTKFPRFLVAVIDTCGTSNHANR